MTSDANNLKKKGLGNLLFLIVLLMVHSHWSVAVHFSCPDDTEGFEMEMSSFLSEFGCPHAGVSSGDSAQRFRTKENCLVLLDYLLTELQAAQMTHANHPRPPSTPTGQAPASLHSGELKAICITLGMSRPPPNITTFQFFTGVEKKLREFLSKVPQDHIGKPLMKRAMAPGQWAQLDIINRKLSEEYRIRREMLLKRLDVTIQSFNWSNKTKGKEDAVAQAFRPKRQGLSTQTNVILADLLSAREDIARMQKTTYGATRHNCAINKVLMGRVPDRGGRAWERAPPPKEMPAFKKREDGGRGRHSLCYLEALVEAEVVKEVDLEEEEEEGTVGAVLGEGEYKEAGRTAETTVAVVVAVEEAAAVVAVEGAAAEVVGVTEVAVGGEGGEEEDNITSSRGVSLSRRSRGGEGGTTKDSRGGDRCTTVDHGWLLASLSEPAVALSPVWKCRWKVLMQGCLQL
ncbi:FAM98A [Branchiostoma lanceolatum]|uniref:FAM98A protein n=1 Tax=Branchiostoma lanceolatum TaxID=7740 RepID=A0A8J9ZQM5_BRALA|nr:FAM98A [Branchiostoma lanceolatum]